jgi:hypothetical protein
MADKKREEPSVLGTLSSTRPERLGAPRGKKAPRPKRAPTPRPAAVSPGSPPLRPHRNAEAPISRVPPPKGAELVTTAIQAAGELAQIGFTVGGQVLKRAMDRLPRP